MRRLSSCALLVLLAIPGLALAVDCTGDGLAQPPSAQGEIAQPTSAEPVQAAVEGEPQPQRQEECQQAAAVTDPAKGYVPKTQFDNTPYRFNAQKGFTAAEFDAWMKSRGIRIATGKPKTAESATAAPTAPGPAPSQPTCQQSATTC